VNCNLAEQQRGWECWKCTGERERGKELISVQTLSKQTLERQKGEELVGDKPLPKAGQVVDHRAIFWACELHPKSNCPTKLKNKQWTVITHWQQRGLIEHWNCLREKGWGKEISPQSRKPSKHTQWKATSKTGQWVNYRPDLLTLRAAFKLKQPYLTGGGDD
jgi:hypothetical protein